MSVAATGTVAGVVVAIVYWLSPMTVWVTAAMVLVFVVAGWGLPHAERRWVWTLLAGALAIRVLMVVGLAVTTDHDQSNFTSFFFDNDGRASKLRSTWVRNVWLELPVPPVAYHALTRDYGWTSYLSLVAYLQYLIGPAPYGIHLLNSMLFLAAAVLLHRMARRAYGPPAACAGFGLLLFHPSLILWSTSAMKESLTTMLIVGLMVAAIETGRHGWWARRTIAAVCVVVVFAALMTVTRDVALVTLAAAGSGVVVAFVLRRRYVLLVSPVLLAVVAFLALQHDAVRARVSTTLATAVTLHMGHVHTEGHSYKLLDEPFYAAYNTPAYSASMTPAQTARFVTRGLAAFMLMPLPWQSLSRSEVMFIPAQMYWYCLLLLAAAGVATALRREVLTTSMLLSGCVLFAAARGLTEGNLGTLVRHRDVVVPLVVWFSGVGAFGLLGWLAWLVTRDRVDVSQKPEPVLPPHRSPLLPWRVYAVVVPQVCRQVVSHSQVCRALAAFMTEPTRGLDLGVPHEAERQLVSRLGFLARASALCRLGRAIASARQDARVLRAAARWAARWSVGERFAMLGWTTAVAVVLETARSLGVASDIEAPGVAVRSCLLLSAAMFMANGHAVAAAWAEWRNRMGGHPAGEGAWIQSTPAASA